jgi:antitoxin HicB
MELNEYLDLPYTITLRRDDEGDWIARVQELSGCTAHGSTEIEALQRLEEAKREWLVAALEDHVSIPLPDAADQLPSGKWVQRVPRSLHQSLARLAKSENTSLNQLVMSVLSSYVGGTQWHVAAVRGRAISGRLVMGDAWFVGHMGASTVIRQDVFGKFVEGAANMTYEGMTREKVR